MGTFLRIKKVNVNRESILFRLNAIIRHLTCMNQSDFDTNLSDSMFEIKFDHYSFNENARVHTQIKMNKVEI